MKDRLVGMMGTLGLVLVLTTVFPVEAVWAWPNNTNPGCTGNCNGAFGNASGCVSVAQSPCTGTGCGCEYESDGVTGKCYCRVPVPASP